MSEQYSLKDVLMRQKVKEEFIYEWIYTRNRYKDDLVLRGRSLNIDISNDRVIIIVYGSDVKKLIEKMKSILFIGEYVIHITNNKIAVIINYEEGYMSRIKRIDERFAKYNIKIGIGNFYKVINESLREAMQAVLVGGKIFSEKRIVHYKDIEFYCNSISSTNKQIINTIKLQIEEYKGGQELLETFIKYIELNGEKNRISEELHIHRNTLNYRLNIIEKITGLDLNSYMDMYILITLYLMVKMKE